MSNDKMASIKFEVDPLYRRIHAVGFWGAFNNHGELMFDIFEDVPSSPDCIKIYPPEAPDGQPKVEYVPNGECTVIRRVKQVGVTVPKSAIPGIIRWFQDRLEESEEANK